MGGLGVAIVSTSKGVMTDRAPARQAWVVNHLLRRLIGGRKCLRVAKAPVTIPAGVEMTLSTPGTVHQRWQGFLVVPSTPV